MISQAITKKVSIKELPNVVDRVCFMKTLLLDATPQEQLNALSVGGLHPGWHCHMPYVCFLLVYKSVNVGFWLTSLILTLCRLRLSVSLPQTNWCPGSLDKQFKSECDL